MPGELAARHIGLHPATTPRDLAQVRELFVEYAAGLGVSLCFQDFDAELAALPGDYVAPAGGLWLATAGPEGTAAPAPVGCIALRPLRRDLHGAALAHTAELKRLYVRPAARGSGLGRKLAAHALDYARQAGYRMVKLDTLAAMASARALYASLGFRPCAAYYDNPLGGTLYMELPL